MKISTKLVLMFVGCGLIPITLVGYLSYRVAVKGMENVKETAAEGFSERAQSQLVALRDLKKQLMENYCDDRQRDMDSLVDTVVTMQAAAEQKMKDVQDSAKKEVEAEFKQVKLDMDMLASSSDLYELFDKLKEYHDEMETGADESYDTSTLQYQELSESYGALLSKYVSARGYGDAYVICISHGHVMYSVKGNADCGTNLAEGKFKQEGLANLWQKVRDTKETAFTDFAPYTPCDGRYVGFVGSPILNDSGEEIGMVALQIDADRLNKIAQRREGLGKTGETYLIGKTATGSSYRSDRVIKSGRIGDEKSDKYIELALSGNRGTLQKTGSTGNLELVCYSPLEIPNNNWCIITTISLLEVINQEEAGKSDWFANFNETYGYYDLLLLSPEGHCIYTVCRESDYDTNMLTGPYKDSNFGQLVRDIIQTKAFSFSDFEPYEPSNFDPAAFIGAPIMKDGELSLIAALQLTQEPINEIMCARTGMGETGCTYLVGLNRDTGKTTFRSDLTAMDPKYTLGSEIATDYIAEAFQTPDAIGQGVWKDSHGNDVVAAYCRFKFFDKDWGLFGKQNGSEAFAAVNEITEIGNKASNSMLAWTGGISIFVTFVVIGIGIVASIMIVRPLKNAVSMLKDIAEGEGDLTRKLDDSKKDELGELAYWFNEFVGKLRVMIESLAGNSKSLGKASSMLASTANELTGGAKEATAQTTTVVTATEQMSLNMNSMAVASEQMTGNVRSVASAAEELANCVTEIANAAEHASSVAGNAAELTQSSNDTISVLGDSANEIGQVIEVIQDIACQTNLLALNATIEAARAGAAGHGFAVVASEVKELARKTADATEEIRPLITGIQTSSSDAVDAINKVSEVIDEVKEVSRTIASAVEEQTITTREIAQNITETSEAAETVASGVGKLANAGTQISESIAGVDKSVRHTSTGAVQTQNAGDELHHLADELNGLVQRFKT
ncbi:Methyl-accepting chemotaxis protein 4 [Planctomycetes bacterium CA13]|uniref:Methyl-accepting chemotaxis protein 4 n=1 Tax=Novipirellula herctigrandis TaxID=2527986 RepID=A0A5C5Z4D7_9BACT|nr:Methyl-accepting chemotaxis protein 4 [Planctomycetes bacterium CA13]